MKKLLIGLLVVGLMIGPAFAHPGGTDSSGGHYNRSTGEYHYHHGYSAHDHVDGVCPYDYDDRTGERSGSSGSSNSYSYTPVAPVVELSSPDDDKTDQDTKGNQILLVIPCMFVVVLLLSTLLTIGKSKRAIDSPANELLQAYGARYREDLERDAIKDRSHIAALIESNARILKEWDGPAHHVSLRRYTGDEPVAVLCGEMRAGKWYHNQECELIKKSNGKYEMILFSKAQQLGMKPCVFCRPRVRSIEDAKKDYIRMLQESNRNAEDD